MRPISYVRATDVASAIATVSADPDRAFLAGGTTEVDLLRQNVVRPSGLVDINALPLIQIEDLPDGGLRIEALARMSDVAAAPGVVERFPMLAQALLLGASPQLRHMASMGGNLLQRVRAVATSATRARPATSASRGAVVPRWRASTGATRSSAPASSASPRIPRTPPSPSSLSTPLYTPRGRAARARFRSTISSSCPAIPRIVSIRSITVN
jgi:CO/xanthine dehydrogenase FAD-binding subunit